MVEDPDERLRLELVAETAAEFEKLVRTKTPSELVGALLQLELQNLRSILLGCVLIEQRRRGDRSGPRHGPNNH